MSDLSTQLREYGRQLDAEAAPLPTTLPEARRRPRPMVRRPIFVAAAAAIATLVLVGSATWLLRGETTGPTEPAIPEAWTVWTPEDGIVSECACRTVMAEDGTIWIVGFDGISRFDGDAWQRIDPPQPIEGEGWPDVAVAPDSSVWFSGMSYIARYLDGEWGPVVETLPYTAEEGPAWFEGVWIGPDGEVWTAYRDETGIIHDGSFMPRAEPDTVPTEGYEAPENTTIMATAPDGTVWMAMGDSLLGIEGALISYDGEQYVRHALGGVETAAFSSDGTGWFLVPEVGPDAFMYGRVQWSPPGLYRLSDGEWYRITTEDGLAGYRVTNMIQGPSGDLWLVDAGGLVTRYEPGSAPQAGSRVEVEWQVMSDDDWPSATYPPPTEAPVLQP